MEAPMTSFDTSVPNVARMYDYALGGKDNFPADREAADKVLAVEPDAATTARDNRLFLQRAVRYIVQHGVGQFIDIGSGLPTVQNTHEVAQSVRQDARVAYVDYDPVVVGHAEALLADNQNVIVTGGDLRRPEGITENAALRAHIDFTQPVAVMLVAVLHFLDDTSYEIIEFLKRALPPGSYPALSHATPDHTSEDEHREVEAVYDSASASLFMRTRAEIARFFDGFGLIEPGIAGVGDWQAPAHHTARTLCYGGVGLKP
jgi:O-methyltransferase involved in polyketide biosynthesis